MRIIGGTLRGRVLKAPKPGDQSIRPTTDRMRESLFNVLEHRHGDALDDTRVLDLFAGTGALGFEALSRGAAYALFVDQGVSARALIRENLHALGLQGRAKLFRRDATKLGEAGAITPFDLVFADPPYGRGLGERALDALVAGKWLAPDALIIVEEAANAVFQIPEAYMVLEERKAGDTVVRILKRAGMSETDG
ncbi:MAG: 16S rRNA (guanine(966)-N(2))-methyltransferase RsmD [Pseudomonadota bacterium]